MGRNTKLIAGVTVAAALGFAVWMTAGSDEATAGVNIETKAAEARESSPVSVASLGGEPASKAAPAPALPAKARDRSPVQGCATRGGADPECPFLQPDDATMQEMARCGIARIEVPRTPQPKTGIEAFPKSWREEAGVTEAEHARLEKVAVDFSETLQAQWTELAVAAGIDRAWAETSAPVVVSTRVFATFDEDQYASAVEGVARERAGWDPLAADVPATLDEAVRLRLDTGNAYEAAIAKEFGDARAAELRAAADGWPGSQGSVGNQCEIEPEPARARDFVPRDATEAEACIADPKSQNCAFLEPTDLELARMADCGVVRFDAPGFLGARFSEPTFGFDEQWASEAGLTTDEAAAFAEVGDAFRDALYADLTKLALEAGKSQEWADQTPFLGMMIAIAEGSGATREDTEAMFRLLAEERAGRSTPPTDLSRRSIDERFMRRVIELGDDFEKAVAQRIGEDRAQLLRRSDDGWPGLRLQTQNYCDHSKPQTF